MALGKAFGEVTIIGAIQIFDTNSPFGLAKAQASFSSSCLVLVSACHVGVRFAQAGVRREVFSSRFLEQTVSPELFLLFPLFKFTPPPCLLDSCSSLWFPRCSVYDFVLSPPPPLFFFFFLGLCPVLRLPGIRIATLLQKRNPELQIFKEAGPRSVLVLVLFHMPLRPLLQKLCMAKKNMAYCFALSKSRVSHILAKSLHQFSLLTPKALGWSVFAVFSVPNLFMSHLYIPV